MPRSRFPAASLPTVPPNPLIDTFVDALWLEEGLSKNTLAAYRRDLTLFDAWLAAQGRQLQACTELDLNGYFAEQHAHTKATTANRRLNTATCF